MELDFGKRYSMDVTGDGAGTRELKRKRDHHQDEHENLRHDDGTYMTEKEQVAMVMALSDLDGAPPPGGRPDAYAGTCPGASTDGRHQLSRHHHATTDSDARGSGSTRVRTSG